MTTQWIYRINVIIPASDEAAMNALWTVIAPDGDAEANTFGVPLSVDGLEPVTHYGISTAATEEIRLAIEYLYAGDLADAIISRQDYTLNDWAEFLAANRLKIVQAEVL